MNVRFDVVELCSLNQREHDRGAFAAAIGAGEQPCLATERDAAQRPFGCVVADADAAIAEEAGKRVDAFEHVVKSLGDGVVVRQLRPLLFHPRDELVDQRCNISAARGEALLGRQPVDAAFQREDHIELPHGRERNRRD